jgi:hypothetical protein
MSFSAPGQLLVSRSFYEVASRLSSDYASLFTHEGSRSDKHVREHEVHSVIVDFREVRKTACGETSAAEKKDDNWRTVDFASAQGRAKLHEKNQRAQIFDAGAHLVISGYSKSRVEGALNTLAAAGGPGRFIAQPGQ